MNDSKPIDYYSNDTVLLSTEPIEVEEVSATTMLSAVSTSLISSEKTGFDLPTITIRPEDVNAYLYSFYGRILFAVVMPIIFAIGVIGNLVVIYAISRVKELQTPPNVYILGLAVSDFVLLTSTIPRNLIMYAKSPVVNDWKPIPPLMMNIAAWLSLSSGGVSEIILITVTLERFFAICYPIKFKNFNTLRRSITIVVLIILSTIVINVPYYFLYEHHDFQMLWPFPQNQTMPGIVSFPRPRSEKWLTIYGDIMIYVEYFHVFTLIIICLIFYPIIIFKLRSKKMVSSSSKTSRNNKKEQAIRAIAITVVVSMILMMPKFVIEFIYDFLFAYSRSVQFSDLTIFVSRTLAYCNSAINPILYNTFSSSFRAGVIQAFSPACRNNHP